MLKNAPARRQTADFLIWIRSGHRASGRCVVVKSWPVVSATGQGAYKVRQFASPVKLDAAMAGLEIPDKPNPEYWRNRAMRTRAQADRAPDARSKLMLLTVVDSYERLAQRIELRLRRAKKSK
jgi:hypothetical protein